MDVQRFAAGVELEAQYRPVPALHFYGSAGYLKAKYLQFIDGTRWNLYPHMPRLAVFETASEAIRQRYFPTHAEPIWTGENAK